MRKRALHRLMRIVAAVGLLWQVTLPASVAVAQARGLDVSEYVCTAPGGTISPEARRLAHKIADLIGGGEEQDRPSYSGDCPLCVLAHGAPLPEIELPAQLLAFSYAHKTPANVETVVHAPRGPPVGAQGPPIFI